MVVGSTNIAQLVIGAWQDEKASSAPSRLWGLLVSASGGLNDGSTWAYFESSRQDQSVDLTILVDDLLAAVDRLG